MDAIRQSMLCNYITYLSGSNMNYSTRGKYIQHVADFLDKAETINRKGYLSYRRKFADVVTRHSSIRDAICDFLAFQGIGFKKIRQKKDKPLEKLTHISEHNQDLINKFIEFIVDNNDFSPHTINIYATSIRQFFEYSNDFSLENCKRFVARLEADHRQPATINLRMTALEKFSKFIKKPVELNHPKIRKSLSIENIPTETEYHNLLDYLDSKKNRDYYFFIKILATTGARLCEFTQFRWEDIVNGEVTLKGKGNKYRRFFFTKDLQREVRDYVNTEHKTGIVASGKFGQYTQRGFSAIMKQWGSHVGIDTKKMHPHAWRHFFAKMFLKNNKDVVQLADLMGHSSIDMTRIYLQKSYDEQKKDFDKNVKW